MDIETGTVADDVELLSEIKQPPVGATDAIVTVATLDLPPFTEDGVNVIAFSLGGFTVRFAVNDTAPQEPVRVAIA